MRRGSRFVILARAIVAFAARLYLAAVWARFALLKIQNGWLAPVVDGTPLDGAGLRPVLTLVANGQMPTASPIFEPVARLLVSTGADAVLAVLIPIVELSIGLALAMGIAPRLAALGGIAMNVGFMLAGIANIAFDVRVIALQMAVIACGSAAGAIGVRALWRLLPLERHHRRGSGRGVRDRQVRDGDAELLGTPLREAM